MNAFDQLTEVESPAGSILVTYRCDANVRRVYSKDSNGETYYCYNGLTNQVLFEENASGGIKNEFTYDDMDIFNNETSRNSLLLPN